MLAQMRDLTRNWFARIFIGVIALASVIVLFQGSFMEGLSGLFNPSGVATVGGQTIAPQEVDRELTTFLRRRTQEGQPVSRQDAIAANIPSQILESLIRERAAGAYAERLGIGVSDAQLAEALRSLPAARNPITQRFDGQAYQRMVGEMGYSSGEFEGRVRRELMINQMLAGMMSGFRAPSSYGALALALQSERRTLSAAQITPADVAAVPTPTLGQLRDYYDDHRTAYAIPESRDITLVFARTADFAGRVNIPEARIRQEFESRRSALTTAEQRSYVSIAAPDQARAQQAADRLSRGEDPAVVGRALGLQVQTQTNRARSQIGDSALAAAVFSMSSGGPARAVQTQLSPWTAVRLTSVTAGRTPTLETERDRIRQELGSDEGDAARDHAMEAFESARDGGAAIPDAARTAGLSVVTITGLTAQGRTLNGQTPEALTDQQDIVRSAFETAEGESTDFQPAGENVDALIYIDRVNAASTRPFEQVRADVQARWIVQERGRLLQEAGDRIRDAVEGGRTFAQAAAAAHVRVMAASQTVNRASAAQQPDQQLAQLIFSTPQRQVGTALRPNAAALVIVYIENVQHADPAQNRPLVEQLRTQLNEQVANSVVDAISATTIEQGHPRRNTERLNQIFARPQEETAAQ